MGRRSTARRVARRSGARWDRRGKTSLHQDEGVGLIPRPVKWSDNIAIRHGKAVKIRNSMAAMPDTRKLYQQVAGARGGRGTSRSRARRARHRRRSTRPGRARPGADSRSDTRRSASGGTAMARPATTKHAAAREQPQRAVRKAREQTRPPRPGSRIWLRRARTAACSGASASAPTASRKRQRPVGLLVTSGWRDAQQVTTPESPSTPGGLDGDGAGQPPHRRAGPIVTASPAE